jgi:hypothetical protein
MAILGGDSSSSSSSSASNQISFNPIITALTGTGTTNPTVTAPQTLTPTVSSNASDGADTATWSPNSLQRAAGTQGAIGAGQTIPSYTTDPSGVSLGVKTNSQTMIWVLLFGGFAMVLLMGGGGGRR